MSIENAEFRLSQGLQRLSTAIVENDADSISRDFFRQFDGLVRSDSTKLDQIVTVTLDAAKTLFQVRSSLGLDAKSGIKLVRDRVHAQLPDLDLPENVFKGVDYLIQTSEAIEIEPKTKPPALTNSEAQLDASNGINTTGETTDAIENLADNMELLSKKLTEAFTPVVVEIAAKPENLNDLIKLFENIKGDKNVQFNSMDLDAVKQGLYSALVDGDLIKVEKFLNGIENDGVKFHLSQYMITTLKPLVSDHDSVRVALGVDKKLQGALAKVLEKLVLSDWTLDRNSAPKAEDVSIILEKRSFIADAIIITAQKAKAHKQSNPEFDVSKFFVKELQKLNGHILESTGAAVTIYKDDLKIIADHLEATKDIPQSIQKLNIENFIKQYGKYALMSLPVILGPVASIVSHIPIIGRPIASLVPMLNTLATSSVAPMLMAAFLTNKGETEVVNEAKHPSIPVGKESLESIAQDQFTLAS